MFGNVSIILNNLNTIVYDLDVGKLKTFSVDLKTLSDVTDNKVVKNTETNILMTNVNNFKK